MADLRLVTDVRNAVRSSARMSSTSAVGSVGSCDELDVIVSLLHENVTKGKGGEWILPVAKRWGGRARRAWWGGRDVAQLPLRQRFALPPPHACGTGRILALQLLEHMIGARHLEFAGGFDIELFDDAVVDDHQNGRAHV